MEKKKYEFNVLEGGFKPEKGSKKAAGYDMFVKSDTVIPIGRSVIPMGFSVTMEDGLKAKVLPKSGQSLKGMKAVLVRKYTNHATEEFDVRIDADVLTGTIDSDYADEVGTIINFTGVVYDKPKADFSKQIESWHVYLAKGTAISQLEFEYVPYSGDDGDDAEERKGGFGSTHISRKGK